MLRCDASEKLLNRPVISSEDVNAEPGDDNVRLVLDLAAIPEKSDLAR